MLRAYRYRLYPNKYGMKGEYYFSSLDGDYALIYSEEVE